MNCASGCSPTAMAIIFGYYDRKGLFPNLYGNASQIAPDRGATDSLFQSMVNTLHTYMQTYCIGGAGGTDANKIPLGMQYARDRGYGNSPNGVYSAGGASFLFPRIRTEINAARPLIATFGYGTGAHSVVVYGYNDTGILTTSQVRINYGWDSIQPDRLVSISTAIGDGTKISNYSLKNIITVPVKF